ncbi:MAG TPA: carboxypeptidase regulatory-like domain-containing protein [Vicinamibacterales bacterium]|nr:carboxypeptidase regulatory-like domain-containing protein [Vicinamibacterales bacterium]
MGAIPDRLAAQDPPLARAQILITGGGLLVSPAHQVVPRNTATLVQTLVGLPDAGPPGTDGADGEAPALELPPDALVVAELVGPSFGAPVPMTVRPGEPFKIPPLALNGFHFLRDIHVTSGGATLLTGEPDTVTLEVIDKVIVSQVTTRPLSADEIRQKGIAIDERNFQVLNFTFALGLQGQQRTVDLPMIVPARHDPALPPPAPALELPPLQPATAPPPSVPLATLQEVFQTANVSISGLILKVEDEEVDRAFSIPPLTGVVIIPGNIAYLNQFFSVLTMVSNVTPGHSNLVVENLEAEISLPEGSDTVLGTGDDPLRMARVGTPPVEQSRTQRVVQPGPDGTLGTADDIPVIPPQQNGNAEHLVEGLREGTHIVRIRIRGLLVGLPIGPVPVSGEVLGTVEVRNPTFSLTLTHPPTVSAGEEYEILVTVWNTSSAIANFVSVNLLPRSISGATLLSSESVQVETIEAGDAATVSFRLRALTSGTVTATSFTSEGVPGRFELRAAVGALGIPMSPNTLALPPSAGFLPDALRSAGLAFLGQAFALATSPVTPKGLLPMTPQIVYDRAALLAQAGRRAELQEPLDAIARDLALDWAGGELGRLADRFPPPQDTLRQRAEQDFRAFDVLLRQSARGAAFLQALGDLLGPAVSQQGAPAFHDLWARAAASRPPHLSVIAATPAGSPPLLQLVDPASRRLGASAADVPAARDVPFGAFVPLRVSGTDSGSLAIVAAPQSGLHVIEATGTGADPFALTVVVPEGGRLRRLVYETLALAPGGKARLTLDLGGANAYQLEIDTTGDGIVDARLAPAASELVADAGPQLLSAVRVVTGKEDLSRFGQLVGLLFSEEISKGSAQDGVKAALITNYAVEANEVLGAALQPGGRMVLLSLRDGIGPLVTRHVTVRGIQDLAGNPMDPSPATVPIAATIELPGGAVAGRVRRADGTPVPRARVRLAQVTAIGDHAVTITVKDADDEGRFGFDYVRAAPTLFEALDLESGERGEVRTVIRDGERRDLDILLLGTGTLAGTARTPGGAPLKDAVVRVSSLTRFGAVFGAVTDAAGAFSIAGIPVGPITIEAAHVGTNSKTLVASAIPTAGAVAVEHLTLIPLAEIVLKTGVLAGQVFRADGVTPAAGVPVFTSRGGLATTDASGSYRIEGLPEGELTVRAIDQARFEQATAATTIAGGRTVTANLRLAGGFATVSGVVLDADGTPVANAVVGGGLALARTGADGQFTLGEVPLGSRTLTAVDEARALSGSTTVTLAIAGEHAKVQIVLEARGTIAGRVFEADGTTPVAGLKVFLLGGRNLSTTTDANGGYEFRLVPVGGYTISAFRPDFSDGNVVQTKIVFKDEVRIANVVFRGKGRVTGTVFAADGQTPLAATVGLSELQVRVGQLRPPENFHCLSDVQVGDITLELPKCESVGLGFQAVPLTRLTDSDVASGRFAFEDVFVGGVTVQAANAFNPVVMTAAGTIQRPGDTLDLTLRLTPTSAVTGTVFRPDGVTRAGQDVVITFNSGTLRDVKVVTGENGRYHYPLVNPGSFDVTAQDPASGLVGQSRAAVEPGATADIPIRLLGRGTVTVEVRGASGPIGGARVQLRGADFPFDQRAGVTGPDGRVTFAGGDSVTEGRFSVSAVDPASGVSGFAGGTVAADGAHVDVSIVLPDEAGIVRGRFLRTDRTTGIPNGQVRLASAGGEAYATTGPNGEYLFEGVRRGEVTLEAFDPVTARRGRSTGRIGFHGDDQTIDVVEIPQGTVKGFVRLSKDRSAVAGADVTISVNSTFGATYRTTSGADGAFAFPAVSAGTFSLQAVAPVTGFSGSASGSLALEGEEVTIDIVVQVPERGRVEGRVTTAAGAPANAAQVTLGGRTTTVDNDGFYAFDDVPVGPVSVLATLPPGPDAGLGTGRIAFDGDVETIDVRLLGTGSVTGLVTTAGGDAVAFARVAMTSRSAIQQTFQAETQTDPDGRFAFPTALVGDISVTAVQTSTGLAGSASGPLAVAGGTVELRVTLQPAGAIRGRVLRESGEPAGGMALELTGGSRRFGSTAADGTFRFRDLALGTYVLSVTDPLGAGIARAPATLAEQGVEIDLGDIALDEQPPRVVSLTPADGAMHVPVAQPIQILFSEPVDPATIDASTLIVGTAGGPVAGTRALSADRRTAIFTPAAPFADFSTISVKVTAGVRDRVGRALAQEAVSSFITADSTPPAILSLSPSAAARNVEPQAVVRVGYSEAIDPARFAGTPIELTLGGAAVAGQIAFALNNTVVVFTPAAPLQANATYQVTVRPAADVFGNLQAQGLSYAFSTLDTQAPQVRQLTTAATTVREGATVSVAADVSGATDVAFVEFFVNGQLVRTDGSAPYSHSFVVGASLAPAFVVSARAIDFAGNAGDLRSLDFTVSADQPPTAAFLEPADGVLVDSGSQITVRVRADDDAGVTEVVLQATGVVAATAAQAVSPAAASHIATFTVVVPASAAPGDLTLRAAARDTRGAVGPTVSRTVRVADATKPIVQILQPAAGTAVDPGATIAVLVSAADNDALASVTLAASGAASFTETRTIPAGRRAEELSFDVAIPATAHGSEILLLTAQAVDVAGNAATPVSASLPVRDLVAPAVEVAVRDGATQVVRGSTFTAIVTATDDVRIAEVGFVVQGAFEAAGSRAIGGAQQSASEQFAIAVPPSAAPGSLVTIAGRATDGAGNAASSAPVSLQVVADLPPTVGLTAPADGSAVLEGSTIAIAADAADDVGVVRVEFRVDGVTIATDSAPPYATEHTIGFGAGGTAILIEAVAVDTIGQTSRASVTLTRRDDTSAPRVQATSPPANAVDVSLTTPIDVTFTEPIDPASVTDASFRVTVDASPLPGARLVLDGNTRVRFVAASPLPAETTIAVELTPAITDPAGNPLANSDGSPLTTPFTFTFLTGRFGITNPPAGADVVENSTLLIEARASASLGVASVVFTVNDVTLPAATAPPYTASVQVPPAATTPELVIVASARNSQGVEIATDRRSAKVVVGLRVRPRLGGVPLGGRGTLSFSVSSPRPEPLAIQLRAGNPAIVSFPVNPVTLPAGRTSIEAPIAGEAAGATTVFGDSAVGTADATVSVSPLVSGTVLSPIAELVGTSLLNPPSTAVVIVAPGRTTTLAVTVLSSPAAAATPVTIASTNPAVATATSPPVAAGAQRADVAITTGESGLATLVIRAGDEVRAITVFAGAPGQGIVPLVPAMPVGIGVTPAAGSRLFVPLGATRGVRVAVLGAPAAADTSVTVTSSDPGVATVSGTPVVRAGEQIVDLALSTGAAGRATLMLDLAGAKFTVEVVVGSDPTPATAPAIAAPVVGASVIAAPSLGRVIAPAGVATGPTLIVPLLAAPAAAPVPVTVSSSNTAVASVAGGASANVIIGAGQQAVELPLSIAGAEGSSVLVFEFAGERRELLVVVGSPPASQLPALVAPVVGVEVRQ